MRSPYISPDLRLDKDGYFLTADRVDPCGGEGFLLKGRADSVTKVGGKRVDLEEVRSLIRAQDGVEDCVVLGLAGSGGRGHLIAALIQGRAVDPDRIRTTLADRLEPYALPRVFRIIDRIPVLENGKYNRQAIERLLSA